MKNSELMPEKTSGKVINVDKSDLDTLRKNAFKMGLPVTSLIRAGIKKVLKITDRNEIIRILLNSENIKK